MAHQPPFKVGDRVRLRPDKWRGIKYRHGIVEWVGGRVAQGSQGYWPIDIRRDGKNDLCHGLDYNWQLASLVELDLDGVCRALVSAYKRGDNTAALILAERIFELLGGSVKENMT